MKALNRPVSRDARWLGIGSLPLLIAFSIQNASNLVFHVAVSRLIGPSQYGDLAALLSVVFVVSVPVSVIQTIVAKQVAVFRAENDSASIADLLGQVAKTLTVLAAVAGATIMVLSPLVSSFLHVSWRPAALIGPYFFVSLLSGFAYGYLQGILRFGALGVAVVAGVAVRLALGVSLAALGLGTDGAMLGTVFAQVCSCVVALMYTHLRWRHWRQSTFSLEPFRHDFRPAFLALATFTVLSQVDLLLVRHYLDADAAGLYSGAGLVARALLFLPGVVSIVAFPRFAELRGTGELARRWLHLSMLAVGAIVVVAMPFIIAMRELIVVLVLGEEFRDAASLVPVLAIAMGALALVNVLAYFHVAAETKVYRIAMVGAVVETGLIALFHGSGAEVATIVTAVAAVMVVALYLPARSVTRHTATQEVVGGSRRPDPVLDVSIVLPCHNSAGALRALLTQLSSEYLKPLSVEIIVVDDGSTDSTLEIARSFGDAVRVIEKDSRTGKGSAIKIGLTEARGRYVAFMDSDGDISADDIKPFIGLMDLYHPDIILGSKRHPLSSVQYPLTRRLMSWTYHKLTRLLFRVNVRDTQTGLKMIRHEVLEAALPRMLEKRFAFDLELLVVARTLGYTRTFEAPVTIDYRFDSRVDTKEATRIVLDTLAVFYRRYLIGSYLPAGSDSTAGSRIRTSRTGPRRSRLPQRLRPVEGSQALRILILNWRDVTNPHAGGAEVLTHELAKQWIANGHTVHILTSRFPGSTESQWIDGVLVHRIGNLRRGTFHLRTQFRLARVRGYDVVVDEINTFPFLTPLWSWRLPGIVACIHQLPTGLWRTELPRPLAKLAERVYPHILKIYRSIPTIALSESTRVDLHALGFSKVCVIPPGNAEDAPLRQNAAATPARPPCFAYVGRLEKNKRPDHALQAFRVAKRAMPDATLSIVGRGRLEPSLKQTLPQGAVLKGHLPKQSVYGVMAEAACLIVPSMREGWGLVVIEANSVGTPAVGYDVPGLRDAIKHDVTGLLVPDGDFEALGTAAVAIASDPVLRDRLSRAAKEYSESFSWTVQAKLWLEAFDEYGVIRGSRRSQGLGACDSTDKFAPVSPVTGLPAHCETSPIT